MSVDLFMVLLTIFTIYIKGVQNLLVSCLNFLL